MSRRDTPRKIVQMARGLILALGMIAALPDAQAAGAATTTAPATWKGDLDGMVARGQIRVLVVYSKTFFFLDRGRPRGLTHDGIQALDHYVNQKLGRKTVKINFVMIPVRRDQLLPWLLDGRGDIAAANLTITPERAKQVDFAQPFLTDVSELVVTGPATPPLRSLDDLGGKEIHVRRSSSYFESLTRLNATFRQSGKPEIRLRAADENLEDEDLLEMLNAGLIPIVVVDSHKAKFWAQVFDDIRVHEDLAVNTGGQIAWAVRPGSPKLRQMIDGFAKTNREGTLLGTRS